MTASPNCSCCEIFHELHFKYHKAKCIHYYSLLSEEFWCYFLLQFSSVQSLSCVRLFATPWIAARQASLSITNSQSSLRFTSIESVMPSSHLTLCCPLLLLPPIPPSISLFQWINSSHEVAKALEWRGIFYFHLDTEYPPFYLFILSRLSILQFDIYLKVENPLLLLVITSLLLLLIFVPGTKVMRTKPLLLQGDIV